MAASVSNVVSTAYVSVGCNRTPNALDWGENGLVCFAASNAVVVYDPEFAGGRGRIRETLCEHQARVNCVRWIPSSRPGKENEFLTGSVDKSVILWQCHTEGSNLTCLKKAVLTDLGAHVNSVDGCYYNDSQSTFRVIIAAGDNKVSFWLSDVSKDEFLLLKTFELGPMLLFDCRVHLLPNSNIPLIACGGDDGAVHLFNFQFIDGQLSCAKNLKIPGHEDWVRSLAFTVEDSGDLLLASAAQDSLIRVWKIREDRGGEKESNTLQSTQGKFTVQFNEEKPYKCLLETVLQGHENWVYGLHWQPSMNQDGSAKNPLRLLSCSMDKTMIIWAIDPSTGLWLDQVRVGEVGGNTLGLYGCRFGNGGASILAHGYQGALHLWHANGAEWKPGVVCGGHFGSVEDMIWDPSGEFIVTVSTDQTTRLHAPWVQENKEITWHEIARPQVHGYDMACIASLSRFRFASGAEEKVVRVFEAPKNFLENFARICQIDEKELQIENSPQGAAVPALGLSNKPIYHVEEQQKEVKSTSVSDQYSENYFVASNLDAPPTEETLIQNTLWPENQKLYGHGYELFSLAADPMGKLLVSASRAQHAEHAAILVWNTNDWSQIGRLEAHNLTVTQMAFSPNGQKLISVSRDRTWAVHEKIEEDGGQVTLRTVAKGSGGSRILWSCDWSHDSRFFVTGSRDKSVVIWEQHEDTYKPSGKALECSDSVTAVTFCPVPLSDQVYLVAVGLDNGQVLLCSWSSQSSDSQWKNVASLDRSQAHHATVKRIKFRPITVRAGYRKSDSGVRMIQLASCGADSTVKIFDVNLGEISY